MTNFRLIKKDVNVKPLLDSILAQPELFKEITVRQVYEGSAHKESQSIFLRWCKDMTIGKAFTEIEAIDYPALEKLPDAEDLFFELIHIERIKVLGRAFIVNLPPGGSVLPHWDSGEVCAYYDRYHFPLQSEEGNEFHCEKETIHMKPGELWWFDNKKTHWVKNNSSSDRIHLIIDARN